VQLASQPAVQLALLTRSRQISIEVSWLNSIWFVFLESSADFSHFSFCEERHVPFFLNMRGQIGSAR